MAGIDVGTGAKRAMDHQIPLIPFIDFLLCLISFLLITAVWNQMARVDVDVLTPGANRPNAVSLAEREKVLHVEMRSRDTFTLAWRLGDTVLDTFDVPRRHIPPGEPVVYPELAAKIIEKWNENEARHFAARDDRFDRAVLHTDDDAPFQDVIAAVDAIHAPRREWISGREKGTRPAFAVTFSVD